MKKSYDGEFLFNGNEFYGVSFGYGAVAEHDCGICDLREKYDVRFSVDNDLFGFDARRTHASTVHIGSFEQDKVILLSEPKYDLTIPNELYILTSAIYPKNEVSFAWSISDFGILTLNKNKKYMFELEKAFNDMDIIMDVNVNTFSLKTTGLTLLIESKIDDKINQELTEQDKFTKDIFAFKQQSRLWSEVSSISKVLFKELIPLESKNNTFWFVQCNDYIVRKFGIDPLKTMWYNEDEILDFLNLIRSAQK